MTLKSKLGVPGLRTSSHQKLMISVLILFVLLFYIVTWNRLLPLCVRWALFRNWLRALELSRILLKLLLLVLGLPLLPQHVMVGYHVSDEGSEGKENTDTVKALRFLSDVADQASDNHGAHVLANLHIGKGIWQYLLVYNYLAIVIQR